MIKLEQPGWSFSLQNGPSKGSQQGEGGSHQPLRYLGDILWGIDAILADS